MPKLQLEQDPIAEKLDELSDLGVYWAKNRDKGIMPNGVRSGMLTLINDICFILNIAEKQKQVMKIELNNGFVSHEQYWRKEFKSKGWNYDEMIAEIYPNQPPKTK